MNEASLTDLSLRFKSANNNMRTAEICSLQSTIEVIKNQFDGNTDKITFGIVNDLSDYKDPLTKMAVSIRNGKYDQCHYVMINLDKIRDLTGFSELISALKDDATNSQNRNNLFIGYRASRLMNTKNDFTSYANIKDLIKISKADTQSKKLT